MTHFIGLGFWLDLLTAKISASCCVGNVPHHVERSHAPPSKHRTSYRVPDGKCLYQSALRFSRLFSHSSQVCSLKSRSFRRS
jgi:hypothetical protein